MPIAILKKESRDSGKKPIWVSRVTFKPRIQDFGAARRGIKNKKGGEGLVHRHRHPFGFFTKIHGQRLGGIPAGEKRRVTYSLCQLIEAPVLGRDAVSCREARRRVVGKNG